MPDAEHLDDRDLEVAKAMNTTESTRGRGDDPAGSSAARSTPAALLSPVRSYSSLIRDSRNTS